MWANEASVAQFASLARTRNDRATRARRGSLCREPYRGRAMDEADRYRKRTEQRLRDAEEAPPSMRLQLITIAQRWFELAEKARVPADDADDKVEGDE